MEKLNEEFNIPYYIFEEITEYIELTALGYKKSMKWEYIKSLLGLAKLNNRFTERQVDYLIEKYSRENTK